MIRGEGERMTGESECAYRNPALATYECDGQYSIFDMGIENIVSMEKNPWRDDAMNPPKV